MLDACSRPNRRGRPARPRASCRSRLSLLDGPGPARARRGAPAWMWPPSGCWRRGADDGLSACTDADSRPASDWLARQLEHVRARRARGRRADRARAGGVAPAPARGVAASRARRRATVSRGSARPIRPPPTTISRARRSASPPASTARSAGSSRWPRSRTRRSPSGSTQAGIPILRHRRRPRAHLRPSQRPGGARAVGGPRRVVMGGASGATWQARSRRAAARSKSGRRR